MDTYWAWEYGTGDKKNAIELVRAADAQRALDAEREKVKDLESQLATLQAQLARWKEALGEWLWNCTNLLGDYHIKTVQDFNEEVNRRIAWLMQHLDYTLPPPMTDEERDRMRKLSEDNAALQADNECKDSLIETLQAQLPAEMPGCTILFKECEKGHGRLTATNWIDHGCGTCTLESLQAQLRQVTHTNARLRECLVKCKRELFWCDKQLVTKGFTTGFSKTTASVKEVLEAAQQALADTEGQKGA